MAVTVVIVSYNSSALLVECVQSVLASSWPVDVIVSDNGSTDGSVEPLEDQAVVDARLKVIRNGRNLGFAAANDRALKLGAREQVLFLNPDCIVCPDTVERMVAALVDNPGAGIAGCLIRNSDGSVEPACRRLIPTPRRLLGKVLGVGSGDSIGRTVEAISGAFMMVRRDVLDRIGAFDPAYFMHWEDLDLCLRCRRAGYDILFVPDVEVIHFRGRSSRRRPLMVDWHKHTGLVRFWHRHFLTGWRSLLVPALAIAVAMRFLIRVPRLLRAVERPEPQLVSGDDWPEAWVFGATSLVGRTLLPRLLAAGFKVRAFCTDPVAAGASGAPHLSWHALDLRNPQSLPAGRPKVLIHLAPLPLLPPWIAGLASVGVLTLIAFSSTSRFTKSDSVEPSERQLAADLASAEQAVATVCRSTEIQWAVFRPTMIYSMGHDENITLLTAIIRRVGFLPLPGGGIGRRQPVHADDLAKACIALLRSESGWNRAYNLSGGETLSYRAMIETLFRALGRQPRILALPLPIWRPLVAVLRWMPRYRGLNMEMVNRVNADMCFDHDEAVRQFGFAPRQFRP